MTTIKVVGVGGAGTNAVNRMVDSGVKGVEFIAVNTDVQQLDVCDADVKIHIGQEITHGLGGGADPEVGPRGHGGHRATSSRRRCAAPTSSSSPPAKAAAPAPAARRSSPQVARELGAVTIAIVTKPFGFEGNRRQRQALDGIDALREVADTVIAIPNDRLLEVVERNTSVVEAFQHADDILRQGVQGITDLITVPGLINLDFADVRTIVKDAGTALLGIGVAGGENRAQAAADMAIHSPLLETSHRRRARAAAQHHRRRGPHALRGQRGRRRHQRGRRRRRQHHLRRRRRRAAGGQDLDHRRGHRLRRRGRARAGAARARESRGADAVASAREDSGTPFGPAPRVRRQRLRHPVVRPPAGGLDARR